METRAMKKSVKKKLCPICKKSKVEPKNPWAPFCSQKCKEIDLGKWALEQYRVPGDTADHEAEVEGKDEDEDSK